MTSAVIAKILWVAGIVCWYAIRYPFQRRAAKLGVARSAGGVRDRVLLIIAALGQFIVPAIYLVTGAPKSAEYAISPLQVVIGTVVMGAALVMFRVTHKQLGRNWSVSLETRADHKLVTDGLYRWVRHPMYSSFLLLAIGQCLLLPNWIVGPMGLVALAILFFFRVGREEAMMSETFGEEYRAYMRRTARIVPFLY
jgi:protein-S-isoprenylcysteine O-methyltransferase Ste14